MRPSKRDNIIIQDWAGNVLFEGSRFSSDVAEIMAINEDCLEDIFIFWQDETDCRNV
jgi:hypothetical protein